MKFASNWNKTRSRYRFKELKWILQSGSRFVIFWLVLVLPGVCFSDRFDDHYAVVMIDQQTEQRLGDVPLPRQFLAQAIENLSDAGAKGVILKFFLDREKDRQGDLQLSRSLKKIPVVLQARLDPDESNPLHFDSRFFYWRHVDTTLTVDSGWIPAPIFSRHAHQVGFADYDGLPARLFVSYQNKTARGLLLASLEMAFGDSRLAAQQLLFERLHLPLTNGNRVAVSVPAENASAYIPFHELIEGVRFEEVRGKVVVLGYDGPKIHKIPGSSGSLTAHVFFVSLLRQIVNSLNNGSASN